MAAGRHHVWTSLLAVAIAGALCCVVFLDFGASSPGAISAVHEAVAELRGPASCVACHGAEGGTLAQACTRCHAAIGGQLAQRRGLHGQLDPRRAADCGRCHLEHRGADFASVGDRAFVAAGIAGGVRGFRHEGFAFALAGKHDGLACKACHRHADDAVLTAGDQRFLGLRQECASCHEDPHAGRLPDCASCHGQERPFAEAAKFAHDERFPLAGSHAGIACKACHAQDSAHSIEAVGAARGAVAVRACASCHASAHEPGFLRAVAVSAKLAEAGTCTLCHDPQHADFYRGDADASRRLHACAGLPLVPPHDRLDCAKCHAGIGAPPAEGVTRTQAHVRRFPRRDATRCTSCHESPHTGAFVAAVARRAAVDAERSCELCHGRDFTSIDEAANRRLHEASEFALVPPHDRAACSACHAPAKGYPQRFPGRGAQACTACHEDPHGGQFATGAFAGAACNACHDAHTFRPAVFTAEHHARTAFPLTGAHRAVGCRVCHAAEAGAHPVFRAAPTACGQCHADVHDGAFAAPSLPKVDRGAEGCARCHGTASFRLGKGETFDHGRFTRYSLVGRHAAAACAACHPKTAPTHRGTRTFARAKTSCASCHADPHAGQFAARGATDCARCHTPEGGFDRLLFDHGKHARFALDEHHGKLACGTCHKAYDLPGGKSVVRYRPLGTTCGDCHGWQSTEEYEREKQRRKR